MFQVVLPIMFLVCFNQLILLNLSIYSLFINITNECNSGVYNYVVD